MSTSFTGVPAGEIDGYWPHVCGYFVGISERSGGRFAPVDYFNSFKDRSRQLWIAAKDDRVTMVLVTEVRDYPRKKVAALIACAGEGRGDWLHYLQVIEDWARSQGCEAIEAEARPGWARVLGWKKTHVFLEKGL